MAERTLSKRAGHNEPARRFNNPMTGRAADVSARMAAVQAQLEVLAAEAVEILEDAEGLAGDQSDLAALEAVGESLNNTAEVLSLLGVRVRRAGVLNG